jgi:hypothetical protein
MVDKEDLKQRLKDMGTLSDSRTPKDALEYIEQLEYDNLRYALEAVASLSQAQEAYDAQAGLQEELQEAQQWINYWAKLWERSSTMLMQHHPAFTETTEIIFKDKKAFIKELFGEDLLNKINVVEEDTEDGSSK